MLSGKRKDYGPQGHASFPNHSNRPSLNKHSVKEDIEPWTYTKHKQVIPSSVGHL